METPLEGGAKRGRPTLVGYALSRDPIDQIESTSASVTETINTLPDATKKKRQLIKTSKRIKPTKPTKRAAMTA
jgi:hypothetical protein